MTSAAAGRFARIESPDQERIVPTSAGAERHECALLEASACAHIPFGVIARAAALGAHALPAMSASGAHLANAAASGVMRLFYWRDRNRWVDFVVQHGRRLIAIEVKSGRAPQSHPGLAAFRDSFKPSRALLVGGDGIALEQFLSEPASHWTSSS